MSMPFAIVGPGRVGTALARLLAGAGYEFAGAAGRSMESAQAACRLIGAGVATTNAADVAAAAGLVLITTPDDVIGTVCAELAPHLPEGAVVAHCSGALPSSVLAPARAAGSHVGSLHPLQTLATVEQAVELLPGSYCCIEGDPEAVDVLEGVARAIGARPLVIATESKALYHAAAVMACNYLVTLQDAAVRLGTAAGLDGEEFLQALMPLVRGTVHNLEQVGLPNALTGPIERGDLETVRRHLDALANAAPDLLLLYRTLGCQAVQVALDKGSIDGNTAERFLKLL